jgi:hypothetical protein
MNNNDDPTSETDPTTGLYLTAACRGTSPAQKPNFGDLCVTGWVLLGADGSPLGTS